MPHVQSVAIATRPGAARARGRVAFAGRALDEYLSAEVGEDAILSHRRGTALPSRDATTRHLQQPERADSSATRVEHDGRTRGIA